MKKFFIVLLFLLFAQNSIAAEEVTVRIQPGPEEGKDTYYGVGSVGGRDGRPDMNHLRVGGWGDEWFTFIEFDLVEVPESAEVISAEFGLFNYRSDTNVNAGKLNRVTEYWDEDDPSNTFRPTYTDIGMDWKLIEDSSWWTVDISPVVRGWIKGQYQNYGLNVRGQFTSNNRVKGFYSSDYLEDPSLRPYLEITYTLQEEEEEVDPLVMQYAPKLALHTDEDYLPMDVVDFVEASALWDMDGADTQLFSATELTYEAFETVVGDEDTSEYYLAFSDPDEKKSIDLAAAKTKYDALESPATVYYHKMDDGDYTVLQYWYFYAMNNWKEYDGRNNHEGDWESVFVYLDKNTLKPMHVGYSAHLNDGESNIFKGQYDSVRRAWDGGEVEKEGDVLTSFVALGSHANYPAAGTYSVFRRDDEALGNGLHIMTADFLSGNAIAASSPLWMSYEGKWGTDQLKRGEDGPQGPAFSEVSGHARFVSPVAWAGIDKIEEKVADGTQKDFNFPKAGVFMRFAQAPAAGERMVVDPHDEWISFGEVRRGVTLLPKFWDITSSLENDTFEAEVAFTYDPETVSALGGSQQTLSVFYYDEVLKKWQRQRSSVDVENKTVTFRTTHFSRYAVGFVDEELYTGSLFDELEAAFRGSQMLAPTVENIVRYTRKLEDALLLHNKRAAQAQQAMLQHIRTEIEKGKKKMLDEQTKGDIRDILHSIAQTMK